MSTSLHRQIIFEVLNWFHSSYNFYRIKGTGIKEEVKSELPLYESDINYTSMKIYYEYVSTPQSMTKALKLSLTL